jgi:hypothetical protein
LIRKGLDLGDAIRQLQVENRIELEKIDTGGRPSLVLKLIRD